MSVIITTVVLFLGYIKITELGYWVTRPIRKLNTWAYRVLKEVFGEIQIWEITTRRVKLVLWVREAHIDTGEPHRYLRNKNKVYGRLYSSRLFPNRRFSSHRHILFVSRLFMCFLS